MFFSSQEAWSLNFSSQETSTFDISFISMIIIFDFLDTGCLILWPFHYEEHRPLTFLYLHDNNICFSSHGKLDPLTFSSQGHGSLTFLIFMSMFLFFFIHGKLNPLTFSSQGTWAFDFFIPIITIFQSKDFFCSLTV